jgi:hypothetical protein
VRLAICCSVRNGKRGERRGGILVVLLLYQGQNGGFLSISSLPWGCTAPSYARGDRCFLAGYGGLRRRWSLRVRLLAMGRERPGAVETLTSLPFSSSLSGSASPQTLAAAAAGTSPAAPPHCCPWKEHVMDAAFSMEGRIFDVFLPPFVTGPWGGARRARCGFPPVRSRLAPLPP